MDVIAERELEFVRGDEPRLSVLVRLGRPIPDHDGSWYCPYAIEAQSFRREFQMAGVDSLQALQLAQKIIVTELEVLATKYNGTFMFRGETDLGLA